MGGGSGDQLSAYEGCVNLPGGGNGEGGDVLGGRMSLLGDGRCVVGELSHGF